MAVRSNPFKPLLNSIPAPMRNKYFLSLVFFAGWMIFVDKHDVLTQYRLSKTQSRLEQEVDFYKDKVVEARQKRIELGRNQEEFAREEYYLQRSGEDVYLITIEE